MKHFWTTLALLILFSVILTAAGLWYLSSTTELSRSDLDVANPRAEETTVK